MKKMLLISMVILLFLTSCNEKETGVAPDVNTESKETAVTTQAEIEEKAEAPKCKITFLKEETEFYDDQEILLLLSGQFIYPEVSIPENSEAERLINEYFSEEKAKYHAEAEKMYLDSLELLENIETDYWNTFIYDKKYSIEFLGDELISFLCHTDIYLGGVHPTPDEHGVIFDINSGKRLSLTDVFTSVSDLRAAVLPRIGEMIKEEGDEPFGGFEDDFSPIVDEGTFVITDDGVKFICNVYVLFPYVSGIKYYTVSFDEIEKIYLYSDTESHAFSRFYPFEIDGEIDDSVLGFADTREFSCPYPEIDSCIINGEDRHSYYIIPANEGSELIIEHVLYDENGNESGSEVFKSFKNTQKDFCLKIICPMAESKALYRVTILFGEKKASFDLIYTVSSEKPVKMIK